MFWAAVVAEAEPVGQGRSGDSRARGRPGALAGVVSTIAGFASGCRDEVLVEDFGRGPPSQRLSRPTVERVGDGGEILGAVSREVGAFGEVLPEQPVGVLVGAALPRALRVAEVDLQAGLDLQAGVLGQLGALIPGQRAPQVRGQPAEL